MRKTLPDGYYLDDINVDESKMRIKVFRAEDSKEVDSFSFTRYPEDKPFADEIDEQEHLHILLSYWKERWAA